LVFFFCKDRQPLEAGHENYFVLKQQQTHGYLMTSVSFPQFDLMRIQSVQLTVLASIELQFKTFKLYLVLGSFWLAKDAFKLLRRKKINFTNKI